MCLVILVFSNRLTTLLDVSRTLEYLAYFGYRYVMAEHENQLSAIIGKSSKFLATATAMGRGGSLHHHVLKYSSSLTTSLATVIAVDVGYGLIFIIFIHFGKKKGN